MFADDIDEIFSDEVVTTIDLDGSAVRIISGGASSGMSTYHGEIRTSWGFIAPAIDLADHNLVPDMAIIIDGTRWDIDQVDKSMDDFVDINVSRKIT